MKTRISAFIIVLLSALAVSNARAIEATWNYAVQVSASAQSSPAKVTLNWPQDSSATPSGYTVYRKDPYANSWNPIATLPGSTTSYVDSNVSVGTAYEYQVQKAGAGFTGYGYVAVGVNAPLVDNRGKVVLVVESTYASSLATELTRLQQDLVGDGWTVIRRDVSRNDSVTKVKDTIRAVYSADPANVKAAFLFGRVPVPYSGNIVPDGHYPDHQGAWPADAYYGDMDGSWTDSSVSNTGATADRNRNVPGDGKFDQSDIPSSVELQVGRVDFANMPGRVAWNGPATFPNELELLRNYLNKDHKFRHKELNPPRRGVIHDSFGVRNGEAFAASGYRSISALVGASSITTLTNKGEFIPHLRDNNYLWAYGCGAGSYSSVGGLGNTGQYQDGITPELVQADIKAVFTSLFGSWLGDWDSEDNIMRGVLATQTEGLTCFWSGRPHWYFHHMGMGETIGYAARLTQNNGPNGLYRTQINSGAGQIHVALMGDPTLRMHPVAPPTSLVSTPGSGGVSLRWNASSDSVLGYHVYRANAVDGPYTRVTSSLVAGTSYTDAGGSSSATYMVRAVKLENTTSGSYYNPSQAAFAVAGNPGTTDPTAPPTPTTPPTTNTPPTGGTTPPTGGTNSGPTGGTTLTSSTLWVDDAIPTGAQPGGSGGDSWSWVSNPAPISGSKAHESANASGLHYHYFDWAQQNLSVAAGEVIFAYAYIDPASPPTELMLTWNNGTWEHRAYWGANSINEGVNGTDSRRYMGALPAAGQWARLEVPAAQVGLAGSSLRGMVFSSYNGKVTWDSAGKGVSVPSSGGSTNSGTSSPPATTNTNGTTIVSSKVWVEDSLPAGTQAGGDGGDTWNWVSSNPAPFAGSAAHQSAAASGLHQHYFDWNPQPLSVAAGEGIYTWVYLDPSAPPTEIMLQWNNGTWEHRAYWGANSINEGVNGTDSRRFMGPLPAAGQWVRLEVPASKVGLEGSSLRGMAFSAFGGKITWDSTGKGAVGASTTPPGTNPGGTNSTGTPTTPPGSTLWVDDSLPSGAQGLTDGGDTWTWVKSNPAPYSGSTAHQSTVGAGLHQHYFINAGQKLSVSAGEVLFAYVYIDPANLPTELMLQWNNGSWEHRAYWGADSIQYGNNGTDGRRYMGVLPSAGQWARLEIPAKQVGLENSTISGMAFSQVNGRATWDAAGKGLPSTGNSNSLVDTTNSIPAGTNGIPSTGGSTNPPSGGGTNAPSGGSTNAPSGGGTNAPAGGSTNTPPSSGGTTGNVGGVPSATVNVVDYTNLEMPRPGANTLHILSPTLLELELINTKQPDPAPVQQWNFINNGQFNAPATGEFQVSVGGQTIAVQSVGFKRRPLYAPIVKRDLRLDNCLYLQLATPIADNQAVQVKNPSGSLWASSMNFSNVANPLRYSPAIHVNQEGYMPNFPKKAMVGYFLGNLGEMNISSSLGFKLVDAATGAQVYQGTLTSRPDVGYNSTPTPYGKVLMADFSTFNTPGEYRLQVPGMGASLPFLIDANIGMDFARAYALGVYHQRCGSDNKVPFTRHTHDVCHVAQADVPSPQSSFAKTWSIIAEKTADYANNPRHTAPRLQDEGSQLFPFINKGKLDVSKGHHDAGDYSKYTINTAGFIHYLMFAVDSFNGVAALDNLGIPESGDGVSDLMQIAKWEADYIAKLQDADGGFYFLVYPREREYESNVTPDKGDVQVVWPKTTAVTAAAVAALAQTASSPKFKQQYPNEAAAYLQKAQLGWQFLLNAIAKYGKDGCYQKITHYGDNFMHDDELAWAASQIYLATGDATAHAKLKEWLDPSDPATFRWGWWRMYESYGRAIRSYAFSARSGRSAQLDPAYLAKCEQQVILAAQDHVTRAQKNAYGSSFPLETKAVNAAGWYFSSERAFDITVGYQLDARPEFMDAIISNLNYEGGCNPVNMTYITGLGWKRQRETVNQYALNDRHVLPPGGIPQGNVQNGFPYLDNYKSELGALTFPSDGASTPYPFYDRWGDTWNVSTEFVNVDQSRSLASIAYLATLTPAASQRWTPPTGQIAVAPDAAVPGQYKATMQIPGMDLNGARIVWEARDQEPCYGLNYTFMPKSSGSQWVEAEAQWPDGRRVVATTTFDNNNPIVTWVDDDVPEGGEPGTEGGDSWSWVNMNPTPKFGSMAHQSAIVPGLHQHWFDNASSTLTINPGDVLFAWVCLDPANLPQEIMLQWNETDNAGARWEHRAYWGANKIGYGTDGTVSRRYMGALPSAGQWVRLEIPASQVGLEGKTLKGMTFTAFGGRVTWDAAGKASANASLSWLQPQITPSSTGPSLAWNSAFGRSYRVSYKNSLNESNWIVLNNITASGFVTSIKDTNAVGRSQRFYMIAAN